MTVSTMDSTVELLKHTEQDEYFLLPHLLLNRAANCVALGFCFPDVLGALS